MLYQKICSVGLAIYATLTATTFGSTYYAYSSATTGCSSATVNDRCIFLCNEEKWKGAFDCGDAGICDITCDQKQCLETGTITASNSYQLNVFARAENNEQRCYKRCTFNLPNAGSANFSATASSIDPYQEMIVNAGTDTNNIYIDCTGGNLFNCKKMTVNAQTADFLYINIANSNLDGAKDNDKLAINCPQNPSYTNSYGAPCYIDARNAALTYVAFNTQYGMPHDIIIEVDIDTAWLGVALTCTDTSPGLEVLDADIVGSNDCWRTRAPTPYTVSPTTAPTDSPTNPTSAPTPAPTSDPTAAPTKDPTSAPTSAPTHGTPSPTPAPAPAPTSQPTDFPTLNPTKKPTVTPSETPTSNPSVTPTTGSPTKSPTKHPSISPTLFPSIDPSTYPTEYPSKYPTESPSPAPTAVPSKHPIVRPTVSPTVPSLQPTRNPTLAPSNPTQSPIEPVIVIRYPTAAPTLVEIRVSDTQETDETDSGGISNNPDDGFSAIINLLNTVLISLIVLVCITTVFIMFLLYMCYRKRKKPARVDSTVVHISANSAGHDANDVLFNGLASDSTYTDTTQPIYTGTEQPVVIKVPSGNVNVELQRSDKNRHDVLSSSEDENSDDDVIQGINAVTAGGGDDSDDSDDDIIAEVNQVTAGGDIADMADNEGGDDSSNDDDLSIGDITAHMTAGR